MKGGLKLESNIKTADSYFDGGLLGLIGTNLLGYIVTAFTLGICFPWSVVMKERWIAEHTVVGGKRLRFTGTAMGLFGQWIKILLLCIITLGIYGFWANLAIKKWVVQHTKFA
ncbi:MAG: YjgN family protein [Maledivibacter sp.]|jgi:uncharacterized membrane protein YjgN (DUF898 family)|nr:YjgN family protein [Maledivibacter sp.]